MEGNMIEKSTRQPMARCKVIMFDRLIKDGWKITTKGRPDLFTWQEDEDGTIGFIVGKALYTKHRR
jgi:hypothetical protein